ncbi:NUDIX hydrolase [Thermoflavimicrobium dichotomicum]|uniref:ADP-ribose pyrophosphatase n=1 Tax=Thermoflavimicrobium dichotomicum TaxID=46223 RepID=A0A1I3Q776_9BACL|nr:NUDIX hydrolase [Thermoflavimicrobium dichotomicum]SFJ29247.1 ADP-ribose pyrophosphatase [Thermoflavimicrobium dichotomicum]
MLKDFTEKTIATEMVFKGKIIQVQVDQVKLPNGKVALRELVKHPGAVGIMAITPERKLVLVRQFRKPLEKTIFELPAGKLEEGEDPISCAQRELEEETGYQAETLKHVVSFYTSPGFANEILHLYQAEGLKKGQMKPDQDEFVERVEWSLDECLARIASGDICDAKTIAAIYLWQVQEMKAQ